MSRREHREMLREFAGEDVLDDALDEEFDAAERELADLRRLLLESQERERELRDAATKASAELRHATHGRWVCVGGPENYLGYDANLIGRAIGILEEATTPGAAISRAEGKKP